MCDSSDVFHTKVIKEIPRDFCLICNHKTKNADALKHHVKTKHNLKMYDYLELIIKTFKIEIVHDKLICQICGRTCKDYKGVASHVNVMHKISSKEYYDKYFKKEGEGLCKICKCVTSFHHLSLGYHIRCGNVNCYNTDKDTKEKRKRTNIERLGVGNPSQNEKIKEKKINTNLENRGVKYPTQNEEVRAKSKKKCIEKYGFEYPMQNKEIRQKANDTNLKLYGCENPMQNQEIFQKAKDTNVKRYGCEYLSQSEEIKETRRKNNELKGNWVPLDQLTDFQKYRRLITIETKKHKKELYKNWNHCDYYTGELLVTTKEFKELYPDKSCYENKLRDSIDHKISVSYCFQNNISVEECSRLENLCICSLSNNISKYNKTELKFKNHLKEHNIINTIKETHKGN